MSDELTPAGDCIVKLNDQLIANLDGQVVRFGRITSIGVVELDRSVNRTYRDDGSVAYEPDGNIQVTIKITCDFE